MFPGSTSVTVTRTPPREEGALYTGHIKDTWELVSTSMSVSLCKSTHHTWKRRLWSWCEGIVRAANSLYF